MTPSPENPGDIERLVHQTLRALPPRSAPRSLESRVFAEIARRAALPWWHKSYAYWPMPVRAAFFVTSAVVAALIVAGLFAIMRGAFLPESALEYVDQIAGARSFFGTLVDKAVVVFQAIPTLWLYGAGAVVVGCYATLIGIGAAAYRTLRSHR